MRRGGERGDRDVPDDMTVAAHLPRQLHEHLARER
jgi:hypothetical protein